MGSFLNPNAENFIMDRNSRIYVDKSMMIHKLNELVRTAERFVCVSRPRRFGKTMAANMIAAYYEKGLNAEELFDGLNITSYKDFTKYKNQFDVIKITIQEFLSKTANIHELIEKINDKVSSELFEYYPFTHDYGTKDISEILRKINEDTGSQFIIIIDEWDCIFREKPDSIKEQDDYLDFLRDLLKDKPYIALAYMTGILPIKKYGTHSALNMFLEISMETPYDFSEYTGFTEFEVESLCSKYQMDLDECRAWYDGYIFQGGIHIYNPKSLVSAMTLKIFDDYWNKTETYEALQSYIDLNFDGLKDSILRMMAGEKIRINTSSFKNDMSTFSKADDVLTLLVHLGYLGFDSKESKVFIPNRELMMEFVTATTTENAWDEVVNSVLKSEALLEETLAMNEESVAKGIEKAHLETSHLQYNDENALSYTISLAYYAARQYYTLVREFPSGKGFADIALIPRKKYLDKPALIVELKWDKSANTAINQIKDNKYPEGLIEYKENLLLVGINYDKKTRKHVCKIEKI